MNRLRCLGILGGTLDPVHVGHLDAAGAARRALDLDQVWFVPSHDPPHRPVDPMASPFHRFAMATLATSEHEAYRVSDLELRRAGASYTIDTLRELHTQGWAPLQIFFIIGVDAFAEVASWRAYPEVLEAANFAVISRAGLPAPQLTAHLPGLAARTAAAGIIRPTGAGTMIFPVEATTRDVSSSLVRQRLRDGASIGDLVPAQVERHIMAHGLYGIGSGKQLA
jgi:nicotinate-nucleotide adenylyltransferase